MKGQRWLPRALGVFLVLLVVWIAAALLLNSAAAGTISLPLNLQTRLVADYGDDAGGPLGAFRLSIVGEAMRDQGMPEQEVKDHSADVEQAMDDPVPTATARNFEGDDPFTATPTHTFTPTTTFTPTVTNTPTPIPTSTPEPTDTPKPKKKKPSKTPKPIKSPESTDTPETGIDDSPPMILGDWYLDPGPGEVTSCDLEVYAGELHIRDESYSEGIDWIKLKYYDPIEEEWVYSSPQHPSPPSGWDVGETWDDYYNLSVHISLSPSCPSTLHPDGMAPARVSYQDALPRTVSVLEVPVHAYVKDNAGHSTHRELGVYLFPASCCDDD